MAQPEGGGERDARRAQAMLEGLQARDREIEKLVVYSKFVVAYFLQQDGPSPGWRKANIEGPVFVVRRRSQPKFQLIVSNQNNSSNDLLDTLDADWELDCQKNYIFYRVENTVALPGPEPGEQKLIRGLWFHEDSERTRVEGELEKCLEELKKDRDLGPPQGMEPTTGDHQSTTGGNAWLAANGVPKSSDGAQETSLGANTQRSALSNGAQDNETVAVSRQGLRRMLHELAESDEFVEMLFQKLKMRGT